MADINNIPALMLANSGKEELTVVELTTRGYHLGSNFFYNVDKCSRKGVPNS